MRRTTGEFLQFLGIAKGSLAEMETLLLLSARLSYLSDEGLGRLLSSSDHISRMITALARALQAKPK